MSQLSFAKRLVVCAVIATLVAQGLGVLLWAGYSRQWLPLHVAAGAILVIGLWIAGYMAARSGVSIYRVMFAAFWGFVVIGLGYWQSDLLVGERHRLPRAMHLIAGIAALAQIRYLTTSTASNKP
ncbi:MAG: hypothetical protein JWQ90_2199 [Hydrocarboniphaga sp.]|uniref:hypothetical protein n=1 Tax=Hydrocarboniphaga sp. TaxID=2033016 RepID=UPI002629C1FD|nr:hypothetical protein [Hydrocarboniphaga sp.]MDB5969749.1 hypothetical protein [Hydrocarboniphaga sp.]